MKIDLISNRNDKFIMKKKISLFLILLLIVLFNINQIVNAFNNKNNLKKLYFWKIVSSTNTVYLLGSIHMASKDIYPLDKTIENAFNISDYLVVEADILNYDQVNLQLPMIKQGMFDNSETLQDKIPTGLYNNIKSILKKYNINMQNIDVMKPWLVAFTIYNLKLDELGYKSEFGIDYYFLEKANKKKDILELESIDYQINLFGNLSDELQVTYLNSMLNDISQLKKEMTIIFDYWKNGNIINMDKLLKKSVNNNPELKSFYYTLIDQRNINMAKKIEGYLKDNKTFFVIVGAGHFTGKNGIINILENKGHYIQQLEKAQ